ncbi:MAG: NAD-dependent protein deacylase [Peptococcaceae bacterium]|nr:NAD-dependent protein deacylase [Peptococcaceae bacterium]
MDSAVTSDGAVAVARLRQYIDQSERLVFFGGAGVSTESGIPDFRSPDGLYRQKYAYPPEEILSRSFFNRRPELFFDFYRDKILHLDAKPNAAHEKLAELEKAGRLTAVITQNIDGLHQAAGAQNVLELHGSVQRNYCVSCHRFYDAAAIAASAGVPRCACGGIIKPDVVLYEEALDDETMWQAQKHIQAADLLIVGGTSLSVYPAAGLIRFFNRGPLVLINKSETAYDQKADLLINDGIAKVLSQIEVKPLISGGAAAAGVRQAGAGQAADDPPGK